MGRRRRNQRAVSLGDAKPQYDAIPSFIDEDFDQIEEAEEEIRENYRDNDADY